MSINVNAYQKPKNKHKVGFSTYWIEEYLSDQCIQGQGAVATKKLASKPRRQKLQYEPAISKYIVHLLEC